MQAINTQQKEKGRNAWSGESESQHGDKEIIHIEGGLVQGLQPEQDKECIFAKRKLVIRCQNPSGLMRLTTHGECFDVR